MAEQYDVTTYLLDKENIRDTILRMVTPSLQHPQYPCS